MSKATPVSRLLNPLSWALGLVLVLMAAVAMGGVLLSNRALDKLTEELEPAADANRSILSDMVNMETSIRAYVQSGVTDSLQPYQDAQIALAAHQKIVRDYAARDPEVVPLVKQQDEAIDTWLRDFAVPLTQGRGGEGSYDPQQYAAGQDQFTTIRQRITATDSLLSKRVSAAKEQANDRLRTTLIATGLLALLGTLVLYRVRERVIDEVAKPLFGLDTVVHRLAAGEHSARAREGVGAAEIQSVSMSLNQLAEANEQARAVEKHISDELIHLDMARADFMSNVSHELRTPLTTIAGYLELVSEEFEGRMADRHQKMLDAADRNVQRLRGLIDDLLTLTRAETSPVEQVEPTDVGTLVRHVVGDQAMTAARRHIKVNVTAEEGTSVMADPAMLSRVFVNVLSNAVKFSDKGAEVDIHVTREGDEVVAKFEDHGMGIPASELSRIGSRFYRASNAISGHVSGTGLGLRISQTVVEKHAGALTIESIENEGTTVTVRLPLHRAGDATAIEAPLAESVTRGDEAAPAQADA